ncbi:MAG: aspartate carbamoyltransferase [Rikenellaceae bacterium]|nr:aspartate carbamoyltransferase [Rikenellaceae bacterium]MCL2692402.1 aspartate carbamoyltransferase [Rikenellaceae bacterium]
MTDKSLISITDFSREEILRIMELAAEFERDSSQQTLQGKIVASLFFEPSTRTRLSFESAANRLGASVIGFSEPGNTSVTKGESFHDTIMTVANYSDIIVMRTNLEGAPRYASEISRVPIVNAGDGANQHPTQTLLDLYSILKTQNRLDGISIMLVGDLKYGRTVHSLIQALAEFGARFTLVAPRELELPQEYKDFLHERGLTFVETTEIGQEIGNVDIVYMTRVQRERFSDTMEYERVKNVYVLRNEMLAGTRPNLRILHPLPRVNEIAVDVDSNPKAYYFEQTENGVYVRMAIMSYLLGLK